MFKDKLQSTYKFSSFLLTPPRSSLIHTPPHSSSLLLIPPHSSLIHTPAHSSSLLLTPPHSSSLLLTPHSSSLLLLTPPHSSSLLITPPPHSSSLLLSASVCLLCGFIKKVFLCNVLFDQWQSWRVVIAVSIVRKNSTGMII